MHYATYADTTRFLGFDRAVVYEYDAFNNLIFRISLSLPGGFSGDCYVVFVAEGTFCDFAKFRRLAFCGPTKFSVSRWARHAV